MATGLLLLYLLISDRSGPTSWSHTVALRFQPCLWGLFESIIQNLPVHTLPSALWTNTPLKKQSFLLSQRLRSKVVYGFLIQDHKSLMESSQSSPSHTLTHPSIWFNHWSSSRPTMSDRRYVLLRCFVTSCCKEHQNSLGLRFMEWLLTIKWAVRCFVYWLPSRTWHEDIGMTPRYVAKLWHQELIPPNLW